MDHIHRKQENGTGLFLMYCDSMQDQYETMEHDLPASYVAMRCLRRAVVVFEVT